MGHHGGGASGRAVAFCLSKLGSNPRTDLIFWFRIAANLFSLGTGLFWKNEELNSAYSSFSFPVSYHHCQKEFIKKMCCYSNRCFESFFLYKHFTLFQGSRAAFFSNCFCKFSSNTKTPFSRESC